MRDELGLKSDINYLVDRNAAWEFIQQSFYNEEYCDLDAKEFHLQHPDNEPVLVKLIEVLELKHDGITTTLIAKVKCDDDTLAKCRVSHWNDPGNYWQPPDKGYDFEGFGGLSCE